MDGRGEGGRETLKALTNPAEAQKGRCLEVEVGAQTSFPLLLRTHSLNVHCELGPKLKGPVQMDWLLVVDFGYKGKKHQRRRKRQSRKKAMWMGEKVGRK
jgi:hypothetical protein